MLSYNANFVQESWVTNTYYIRQRISERIAISDIVLGIAGIYASYSNWMKWELDKAAEKGIPIIGVIPRGQERIFSIVSNRAIEIVHCNTKTRKITSYF